MSRENKSQESCGLNASAAGYAPSYPMPTRDPDRKPAKAPEPAAVREENTPVTMPHNEQAMQLPDRAAAFLATLPLPTAEEVQSLLRTQGAKPVARFEDLLGRCVEGGDEFDMDEFLQERGRWQSEGAPMFTDADDRAPVAGSRP